MGAGKRFGRTRRLTVGLFNTTDDVDRFVDALHQIALQQIALGQVHGSHVQDRVSGECRVEGNWPEVRQH